MLLDMLVIFYYVVYIFVFFFKQKTAYEMRISDWSSDVCSSDLQHGLGSALSLFGGLEDKNHPAIEITGFGQITRSPQQHRRMSIMPAGMHDTHIGRRIRRNALLKDR